MGIATSHAGTLLTMQTAAHQKPYKYRYMTARLIREELLVIERYVARMQHSADDNWQRRTSKPNTSTNTMQ